MVVHDAPSFGQLLKRHRRHSAGFLPVRHLQAPPPSRQYRFRTQLLEFQLREIKGTHTLAFGLVPRTIPVERLLPAARLIAIGEEDEGWRFPVPGHEAIEVATVPGIDLGRPDDPDLRHGIRAALWRSRARCA